MWCSCFVCHSSDFLKEGTKKDVETLSKMLIFLFVGLGLLQENLVVQGTCIALPPVPLKQCLACAVICV